MVDEPVLPPRRSLRAWLAIGPNDAVTWDRDGHRIRTDRARHRAHARDSPDQFGDLPERTCAPGRYAAHRSPDHALEVGAARIDVDPVQR